MKNRDPLPVRIKVNETGKEENPEEILVLGNKEGLIITSNGTINTKRKNWFTGKTMKSTPIISLPLQKINSVFTYYVPYESRL